MFLGSLCMMPNIMHNLVCLQMQAELSDSRAVAAAKADEVINLHFQSEALKEANERVQDELKAAAAASHSAAKVGCKSALTVTDCTSFR